VPLLQHNPFPVWTHERQRNSLLSLGSPLGGFQRVHPDFDDIDLRFGMGGKVADTNAPFCFRLEIALAKLAALFFYNTLTAFTLLRYRLKISSFIAHSSFFLHGKKPPVRYTNPHPSSSKIVAQQAGANAIHGTIHPKNNRASYINKKSSRQQHKSTLHPIFFLYQVITRPHVCSIKKTISVFSSTT
jgi:hypothetical protein